ncbi:plasma membrane fusion protein PRM1 [Pseudomassariella vexata]|uniref:Plasma membrane fusion protein PRM1 n=1 Tax=Pseudomassariella vexata TaxID=1141098 RepID=A0A1Y2DYP3_9PEZI|nr:plasma membrane fusion protein PRM1 [Pseudomassariella vexata]ORY64226.1 plasma membrane fusion protein PRM1 [Pseudomassariella vexata]
MPPSEEKDPSAFPDVPNSVQDKPVETRGWKRHAKYVGGQMRGGPTPYLGLPARLSQVWFNRWTILLLLVLARVLIMLAGLNENLGDAKVKALTACTKVEDIGSAMASMPHYLSVGVNSLTASGITHAVHGMMSVLNMVLTGVEQLILFVIHMMTDTYMCLIAMAVHGGLNVSAFVVEKVTDGMNSVVHGVADDIGTIADGVSKAIDEAWDLIDAATSAIGVTPTKPDLDLSKDIDKLKNVKIDTSGFVADLTHLEEDLPTFDDVRDFTNNAVSIPFDLVKQALNKSYGNWEFDQSVFPVAQKEALSFCSDNSVINDFFERLFELAAKAKTAFIVILSVLAVLACIPMAYWEIRRWRAMENYQDLFHKRASDEYDLYLMSSRPLTSKIGLKFTSKIMNPQRERLVRWSIAYGTSLPALFVLSLAIAGFFSCFCQWILLRGIEKEVPELANQVGDFAGQVVTTLENVSVDWANDANGVITSFSDDINNDVLGYVTNATDAVNDTLNTFTQEMDRGLTAVFNGTILENPIKDVVRCLVGLKIESVQKGLTWVHDHAKVTLPLFANDTFSVGAQKSISGDSDLTSFLASPSSVTTDEVTGAVTHVTTALRNNIIQEALISTGLLLVYVLVVLMGIIRMLVALPTAKGEPELTGGTQFAHDQYAMRQIRRSRSAGPPSPTDPNPFSERYRIKDEAFGNVPRYDGVQHHTAHARTSSYGDVKY